MLQSEEFVVATSKDLKDLRTKRSSMKGRLTKYKNYLQEIIGTPVLDDVQINMLSLKLSKLELLSNEFDSLQSQIEMLNSSDLDSEICIRVEIEEDIISSIALTQTILAKYTKGNNACGSSHSSQCEAKLNHDLGIKLPQIQIAKFDGSYFRWLEFHDTFSSLIHKNEHIKTIHKFHYLVSYLQGEAARIVSNIVISEANYDHAWQLLCDRYHNKRQLINFHLTSLFNTEQCTRESEGSLRFLVDHVTKNLRALSSLGQPTEHWDTLIIFLVSSKLNNHTLMKWEELRSTLSDTPSLSEFHTFLINRADVLQSLNRNNNNLQNNSNIPRQHLNHIQSKQQFKNTSQNTKSFVISQGQGSTSQSLKYNCVVCEADHRIYDCPIFKAKSVTERFAEANKLNLCHNCLRPGHPSRLCRMGPCRECKRRHNTLLHSPIDINKGEVVATSSDDAIVTFANQSSNVMLCTALVKVYGPTGEPRTVRALLDCGSQSSFVTEALANELNLNINKIDVNIFGIGNTNTNKVTSNSTFTIFSTTTNFKAKVTCLVLSELTGQIPKSPIDIQSFNIPSGIQLADPKFNQPAPVDMLLGADIFWDILGHERIRLGVQFPMLVSSQLGWLVAGNFAPTIQAKQSKSQRMQCFHILQQDTHTETQTDITDIHKQMCKFWELEELPQNQVIGDNERQCEEHFIKHTIRDKTGRFCVRLPLIDKPDCLGDSYPTAKKRFLNLEKRFKRQPHVKEQYLQFIKEYADLNHLTECHSQIPGPTHYLCHHAVFKENSESTKIRVVFDGSARTSSGYSLNDIQLVGPSIQDSLFSILIRARQYKYLLVGDIEKMYRQIEIHEDQRNLQLILWREDESMPIQNLQLKTVTYGLASASFLSTRCLWQLGQECNDQQIKTIIQHDFYVDDLITGTDSEEYLLFIKESVSKQLQSGCFPLRKFRSNSNIIHSTIDTKRLDNLYFSESTSTLGLGWEPRDDNLYFPILTINKVVSTKNTNFDKLTKRLMMSTLFKIFDPIGLLSPCIIKPKILLQKMWLQKIDWDQPVPKDIATEWLKFISNINSLVQLKIPRYVLSESSTSIELHTFSDASQVAYGACIYLLSRTSKNNVVVRLLCSKSRVAPLKPTTIPRLELCAALLASKLYKSVIDSIRYTIHTVTHWCDSMVTLGWIRTDPRNLKSFVANRVVELNELTNRECWRYVPTDANPADLISRGVDPQLIQDLDLWWFGPKFLTQPTTSWPADDQYVNPDLPEIKIQSVALITIINESIKFDNFSKYTKLQRTFAYVNRFIYNLKNIKNKRTGYLTVKELKSSFLKLCTFAQQDSFNIDYNLLLNNKPLNKKSTILCLSPFLDENKVMRAGGRMSDAEYSYDKRHPIILDCSHHLVKLIFEYEHIRHMHAGPQLLLACVRDYVWPVGGRRIARRTVRSCIVCARFRATTLQPKMGNLPNQRVTADFPFLSVALDFAGPFLILNRKGRGARHIKCYLCIFVCMRYKCVHLEAVTELTKDAFLLSLRRFISRRGTPQEIFCDNGRNFTAAAKDIGTFIKSNNTMILDVTAQKGIKFIFSPPYAPHFNGLAEAGVKSCKFHIKRVLGNSYLTYEEFSTLLAQVEAILNSRPLCPLSSSPDDLSFLSPGHYLIGRPLTSLPTATPVPEDDSTHLRRYARLEQIRKHFWQRWQREYIHDLQSRYKWKRNCVPLEIGDLVLIQEDCMPPLSWKLGRVESLFPGSDGLSRVADVKTARGIIRRSFTRLCPLPKNTSS